MRRFNRVLQSRWIVYHLIFFFLLTPLLSSCGGGGGGNGASSNTDDTDSPAADAVAVTQAADGQNQSAETMVNEAIAATAALSDGRDLIDLYFTSPTPTTSEIEAFVNSDTDAAIDLLAELRRLATEAQTAADALVAAVDELKAQEAVLAEVVAASPPLALSLSPAPSPPRGLVTGGLVILTLFGTAAAVGKGASDAMHACDNLPFCSDPWPSPTDTTQPSFNDCMRWQAEYLGCVINKWPTAAAEGVKATITTGVTTVGSWASGTAGYKKIRFLFDAWGTYDSADGVRKGLGIRRCDQRDPNFAPNALNTRQLSETTFEELTAEDLYIGTGAQGMFHNVPPGEWTFLVFEDGYMRQETGCIDCTGPSPVETRLTLVPLEALEDDDEDGYSEYTGDCDDLDDRTHPGAVEACSDGIDNNCDGLTDCADDACASDAACEDVPDDGSGDDSGDGSIITFSIDIPGVDSFSPAFKIITQGGCSETAEPVPSILATTGGPLSNPQIYDTLMVNLNNDMGTGTWGLGFGPCETPHVFFTTNEILNEDDGTPVTLFSTGGSVSLERYGTALGEPLKGSFNVQVAGDQRLCPTADCDEERVITGTISGQFDGVISNRIQ
jgi:hypothetical protein